MLGRAIIELGGVIPPSKTSSVDYLQEVLIRVTRIEQKLDSIQSRLNESLWERIKRWLGIR
jgi:hypothetical protein